MTTRLPDRLKDALYPTRGQLEPVTFRESGRWLTVEIPDDELFSLTREMILQRVYDRAGTPRGTVIDAGAHVGLFSLIAAQHAERVIALEPDPRNYATLRANTAQAVNVMCLNAALWSADGTVTFDSTDATTRGAVRARGAHRVAARSLDSLIAEYGPIDLLKIDIEGGELAAIPASKRLGEIRAVVGELHRYRDADSRPVEDALDAAGFDVTVVGTQDLYRPSEIPGVVRRIGALRGRWRIKAGVVAYLAAPVEKPRRSPGSRDLPLFVAQR